MARLWHVMLLSWAWNPLCLSVSVPFLGSPQQCEKARFVPGYNLGGEGFDIVKMERKGAYVIDTETWNLGNGTCRMYNNNFMNGASQKVPAAVLDWRVLPKCSLKVSSLVYNSAETLVNDSTSAVSNDWKIGLKFPVDPSLTVTLGVGFGGSHSKESTFAMQKSKEDRYTFVRHSVDCTLYNYRMTTNPPLSQDFKSAVNSLPPYSHNAISNYRSLIDTYGTHFITQVSLGGQIKAITSVKTCQASMQGLSSTEVANCLFVEASVGFGNIASIDARYQHCKSKKKKLGFGQSFSGTFHERSADVIGGDIRGDILFNGLSSPSVYREWQQSLQTLPDVVKYSIDPLHTLLPIDHSARAGLKQEVEKYIVDNAVLKQCSGSCQIGHRSSKRDPCACVCDSNSNIQHNCCPAGKGLATLKVFKLYADGLYGDKWTQTDGSVEVRYGDQTKRTAIISNNDYPRWTETFQFASIHINMKNKLQFTVYDEDSYWNSDLLGECSFGLRKGKHRDSCMFDYGTFFFSYEVECAPSLSGDECQDYIPSPMSSSLAKVFHTRNGVLLGTGKYAKPVVGPSGSAADIESGERATL
uniref:Perforin 1.2 n=1 Tax=Gasterosteus aculeatus aculeatus TaxID=481459 RepID=A0AAQ4Q9M4_GASAC